MSQKIRTAIKALQLLQQNLAIVGESCETLLSNAGILDQMTFPTFSDQKKKRWILQSLTCPQASVRAVNEDIERVRPVIAKLIADLQAV